MKDFLLIFRAKCFHPKLVKLPLPSFLRSFPSEERSHVIQSLNRGLTTQVMLDIGTDHGSGQLRPKGERRTAPIFPGVHFF